MKNFLKITGIVLLILILSGYAILYFIQEKLLFHPDQVQAEQVYVNDLPFEEIGLRMKDSVTLTALMFHSTEKRGLVFYLHGNGGSVYGAAGTASTYLNAGYDVCYIDYRGYGKSGGSIGSEAELFDDMQAVYDRLKLSYPEDHIIVSGTSVGTGIAAKLASVNHPAGLILQSPYYSLVSLIHEKVPIVPGFLIKYKLRTNEYLKDVKCPVAVLHGDADELIPVEHSKRLKEELPGIELHIIHGYGHNDIYGSPEFLKYLNEILLRSMPATVSKK